MWETEVSENIFEECAEEPEFEEENPEIPEIVENSLSIDASGRILKVTPQNVGKTEIKTWFSEENPELQSSYIKESKLEHLKASFFDEPVKSSFFDEPVKASFFDEPVKASFFDNPVKASFFNEQTKVNSEETKITKLHEKTSKKTVFDEKVDADAFFNTPSNASDFFNNIDKFRHRQSPLPSSSAPSQNTNLTNLNSLNLSENTSQDFFNPLKSPSPIQKQPSSSKANAFQYDGNAEDFFSNVTEASNVKYGSIPSSLFD